MTKPIHLDDPTASRMCAHPNKDGSPCGHHAIKGGTVCNTFGHGGRTTRIREAANRRLEEAAIRKKLALWEVPVGANVDPGMALQEQIDTSHALVEQYRRMLLAGDSSAHLVAASSTQRVGGGEYGDWTDSTIEARPSVLLSMYNEERDRLVQYLGLALKVNLRERQQRFNEQLAEMTVSAVRLGIALDWLSAAQRDQLMESVGLQLRLLATSAKEKEGAVVEAKTPRKRLA